MTDRAEILESFRNDEKFLLTTHENPDGDAIGSLVGMNLILRSLGKDTVMFMPADQFPLAAEYVAMLPIEETIGEVPIDLSERTVVYLDCGQFERQNVEEFRHGGAALINIDHHYGNPCFGTLNLVEDGRSSTAEMVYTIARDLGLTIGRDLAEALYVGLVTDTGRFMYSNTGQAAHLMAADLIAAGVDVPAAYRRLYEGKPLNKLQLEARAMSTIRQYDDGLTVISLTRKDLEETGTNEHHTEGIVEFARSVEGTRVAATYRELTRPGSEHLSKISLRSADDRINVSEIAQIFGGGGHRQAAGATTDLALDEVVAKVRDAIAQQLAAAA